MNFDDALLEARGSTPVENVWAATTIVSPRPVECARTIATTGHVQHDGVHPTSSVHRRPQTLFQTVEQQNGQSMGTSGT